MTDVLSTYNERPQRPTFLTVICILTFIGSGWGLISNITEYFNAEAKAFQVEAVKSQVDTTMEEAKKTAEGERISEWVQQSISSAITAGNLKKLAIGLFVSAIFCLAGAILMWKLKKTGFYLYLTGTLIGIIVPFVLFGMANLMAIGLSVVFGFVGLVFVIMYAVNLKYMH